ncbi:hypothetical protein [Nitrobacter sp. JJSN]|uniref:hypothetical protein n=1 Tax=Nitrobacter sp. JJSN TaxID=3453033 RepID=UPI003F773459
MSVDYPIDVRTKDIAVASEIVAELEHNAGRLVAQLERQRRDIADLKDTLAEWRTRRV